MSSINTLRIIRNSCLKQRFYCRRAAAVALRQSFATTSTRLYSANSTEYKAHATTNQFGRIETQQIDPEQVTKTNNPTVDLLKKGQLDFVDAFPSPTADVAETTFTRKKIRIIYGFVFCFCELFVFFLTKHFFTHTCTLIKS
jgi:hypothetical protein